MPIRLYLALLASCLASAVADCAAPFVADRESPESEILRGPEHLFGKRERPVRRQFMQPLALPIVADVALAVFALPVWPKPADMATEGLTGSDGYEIGTEVYRGLADPRTVQLRQVPSLSLPSRQMTLSLDTSGVGRWDTALVELWVTRDGWNWHHFLNAPLCDSLPVCLPGEGQYGLRIVVHRVGGPTSSTPRMGELPQLWIDVKERESIIATGNEEYCSPGKFLHSFVDLDQPADVKEAKQRGLLHPCGYIKRIEVVSPSPNERPWDTGIF